MGGRKSGRCTAFQVVTSNGWGNLNAAVGQVSSSESKKTMWTKKCRLVNSFVETRMKVLTGIRKRASLSCGPATIT